MQYNKGDTIKLKDGKIAIVLDKGLNGKEFSSKYHGKTVPIYSFFHSSFNLSPTITDHPIEKRDIKNHWVLYHLMIGDSRAWLTEVDLEGLIMSKIKDFDETVQ